MKVVKVEVAREDKGSEVESNKIEGSEVKNSEIKGSEVKESENNKDIGYNKRVNKNINKL